MPSAWVVGHTFVLAAANMLSVWWSILLILHTHVCHWVKLIQVKWASCASIAPPPPPCGWVPCSRLWRWVMITTGLSILISWRGARTRQGSSSALMGCKLVLQPHWPWSEKVNAYEIVDIIPCRGTMLSNSMVWCDEVTALSRCSQSSHCLLVLSHTPQQRFRRTH